MKDLRLQQISFNAASRALWEGFAPHRARVSQILGASETAQASGLRLCVLGAGNCNDLDLPALLRVYREVHLVDLDKEALPQAAQRQGVDREPGLHIHNCCDLTGMIETFSNWSPSAHVRPEIMAEIAETNPRRIAMALPGPFDVVASVCLLTQLIGNAYHSIGEAHTAFVALIQAIRAGHLRLMFELIAPRGEAILITDLTSSDSLPELKKIPDSALPDLLPELARNRGFFHGVNPAIILSLFQQDPVLRERVVDMKECLPWRWQLHERTYLVWALKCRLR